jgi:DNA-binding transcriptional MerR regulator
MTDDATLPIGMFSRASSLSIKALRAYHEAGILVPARVDPSSGYRIYSVDQLADAAIVLRLRMLDVPLVQVRTILEARDPELTRRILDEHRSTMQARLSETERIVAELQSGAAPVTHTPVHVRDEDAHHTLRFVEEIAPPDFADWLTSAHRRLAAVAADTGAVASGPAGSLVPPAILDETEVIEAFLPITEPVAAPAGDVAMGEVPAARVAVLVHAGEYETMIDTYRTLGAWVARHAEDAGERIREWCVVGPLDGVAPAAYRTEISWPIR